MLRYSPSGRIGSPWRNTGGPGGYAPGLPGCAGGFLLPPYRHSVFTSTEEHRASRGRPTKTAPSVSEHRNQLTWWKQAVTQRSGKREVSGLAENRGPAAASVSGIADNG